MIWLTWRQHRKQALYTLIALAVLAAVMLPTGLAMHHTFTSSGLRGLPGQTQHRDDHLRQRPPTAVP